MKTFQLLRASLIAAAAFAMPHAVSADVDPSEAPHAVTDKISSGAYKLDKNHGYVTFSYSHLGFSNPQVRFEEVDAQLTLDAEAPANSAVNVTIQASSISSAVAVFDDHLNSSQWFDTGQFPTITFKSSSLEQLDANTGTLTGDLTIKDITRPVTLDVKMLGYGPHPLTGAETVGIEATTMVLRSDFGLGQYVPIVSDEVNITISGEFNKTPPT